MKVNLARAANGDLARIVKFYTDNPDPNVLPRSVKDYAQAIKMGTVFYLSDDTGIVAATAAFPLVGKKDNLLYFEYGGTFIAPLYRGFGLQYVFVAARICNSVLFALNCVPDRIYSFVKPTNTKSISTLTKMGFRLTASAPDAYLEPCSTCALLPPASDPRSCCYNIYNIDLVAVKRNVKFFLDASATPTNAHGDILEISSTLFKGSKQRSALHQFIV